MLLLKASRTVGVGLLLSLLVLFPASRSGGLQRALPGSGEDEGRTVVYRDSWGVPHVYAPSVEDGLYAMGWSQAQDRPQELLRNFLRGMGEVASVEGAGAFEADLMVRMWDFYGVSLRGYPTLSREVRSHLEAFTRGIRDFYRSHPEDLPEWWGDRRVEPEMVVSFARLFLYNWSIAQAIGDLRRGGVEPHLPVFEGGSNQWAVAPERSAEGAALLLIDPHLSWWGPSRFWEFRIHAGELRGSGFTLPGVPYVGLGHNEHLAWAMTTGGPDTADAYELTLHAEDPTLYLYDGEWRRLTSRELTLRVRGEESRRLTLWSSHHGPVVARQGNRAWAARTAYDDQVKAVEVFWRLNRARDYRGAVEALELLQLFPQNVMVADTSGNIYYQRTGRVPIRPEGFDWSRPVNGSTAAAEWLGFHPSSDLLQVLNPPQGYMQNNNVPPDAMMVDSPFSLETTREYLFSDLGYGPARAGWINQRGARAVELLEQDSSVTVAKALDYAVDIRAFGFERWLELLARSSERHPRGVRETESHSRALDELLRWGGDLERDSRPALHYYYWRRQLQEILGAEGKSSLAARIDFFRAALGRPTPELEFASEDLEAASRAFSKALRQVTRRHGSSEAVYGDRFRVGREGRSWPVGGGGPGSLGMTTLRNISFDRQRDDGTRWGVGGQTATQVVVLGRPIRSWSATPVGQSDRPDSPHYLDQARDLFSPRRLKPTWWQPEDLAEHVRSRSVLDQASK